MFRIVLTVWYFYFFFPLCERSIFFSEMFDFFPAECSSCFSNPVVFPECGFSIFAFWEKNSGTQLSEAKISGFFKIILTMGKKIDISLKHLFFFSKKLSLFRKKKHWYIYFFLFENAIFEEIAIFGAGYFFSDF